MASTISASLTSDISPSTITILSAVPATIRSISASSSSERNGLMMNSSFTLATLTSEIGPLNGISLTAIQALAAKPTKLSGITSSSADIS